MCEGEASIRLTLYEANEGEECENAGAAAGLISTVVSIFKQTWGDRGSAREEEFQKNSRVSMEF